VAENRNSWHHLWVDALSSKPAMFIPSTVSWRLQPMPQISAQWNQIECIGIYNIIYIYILFIYINVWAISETRRYVKRTLQQSWESLINSPRLYLYKNDVWQIGGVAQRKMMYVHRHDITFKKGIAIWESPIACRILETNVYSLQLSYCWSGGSFIDFYTYNVYCRLSVSVLLLQ